MIASQCKLGFPVFDMPKRNCFRHQSYSPDQPLGSWQSLHAKSLPVEGHEFDQFLHQAGVVFQESGVATIILVHGTFTGDDPLGFYRIASSVFPELAEKAHGAHRQVSDSLLHDAGNYTTEFAERLQIGTAMPVQLFRWSSENHHLARADAAICLIDRIIDLGLPASSRVLLWGHSHGGNVLALMTNLLAADPLTQLRFFRAARSVCQHPVWQRVRDFLRSSDRGQLPVLDLVTFGTPIRYGWDTDGYGKLLHFVHHRPQPSLPDYRTRLPHSVEEITTAAYGDYIQQWGIAGTNLTPNVLSWPSWLAEFRLAKLLQRGVRRRDLWQRLKMGSRVADEGLTLLVDYGTSEEPFPLNFAGHAVYTRLRWLPFHAQEIANRFYAGASRP